MTARDPQELVVHRAHLIRLGKRAIKRDGQGPRVPAMCAWNFSALGLEHVSEREPLATALGPCSPVRRRASRRVRPKILPASPTPSRCLTG